MGIKEYMLANNINMKDIPLAFVIFEFFGCIYLLFVWKICYILRPALYVEKMLTNKGTLQEKF